MKAYQKRFIYLAFILFTLQGCYQEESEIDNIASTLDQNLKPELDIASTLRKSCTDETITLQVEYVDPTITKSEKAHIRRNFNNYITIYEFQTSGTCRNVELWKVNCHQYGTCQADCGAHTSETVIKLPEHTVINNCFSGRN